MKFCEKIRKARKNAGLKQDELANAIGVSLRTINNYESGERYPKKRETYYKMAEVLNVDVNYLFTDDENFFIQYNAKSLVNEIISLFARGDLTDKELDEIMSDIQEAYLVAKEKNNTTKF
jgi:transcriptional regulator with XRE-family HTH domain